MSSKSKKEIRYLTKASAITSIIVNNCIKNIKSFKNEMEVADFLKQQTKKHNCKLAFKPIVAFGSNAAVIHHKPNNRKLKKGFLLIDFGVKYRGYHSDISRTIYLGTPNKTEKKLYNLVLKAQLKAIKKLKIGAKCNNIYFTAANALGFYKKYFTHKLGHGVGKNIHEAPGLGRKNNNKIKENTVLTVEPGIYLKRKFGIRIEDTILITKNKVNILTNVSKKLITVI